MDVYVASSNEMLKEVDEWKCPSPCRPPVPPMSKLPGPHAEQEAVFQHYSKMAMQRANTLQESKATEEGSLSQEGLEESVEEKRLTATKQTTSSAIQMA